MSLYPAPSVQVDLLALIGRDVDLHKERANEYAGPCPFCRDGTDRFNVWPFGDRPNWWCRRCGLKGDAITYVRQMHGLGFRAAVEFIEGVPAMPVREYTPQPQVLPLELKHALMEKSDACHNEIDGEDRPLSWLAARGIPFRTAWDWMLGYHPGDPGGSTPLAVQYECSPKPDHVSVAHGITVPLQGVDGQFYGLSVRRAIGKPKYLTVRGSLVPLFGRQAAHLNGVLLVVEGWLDAVLLHRLVGDLVDVVALGTAKDKVEGKWATHLCAYRRWLVCMDADPAGRTAAEGWRSWSQRSACIEVPITEVTAPDGKVSTVKDASDYWMAMAKESGREVADQMVRSWIEDAVSEVG